MKKFFVSLSALLAVACNNDNLQEDQSLKNAETPSLSKTARSSCRSQQMRSEDLANDPAARTRYAQNQARISQFVDGLASGKILANGNVQIPVVVNILSNGKDDVTDERVYDQISELNKDFAATNSDINKIPKEFKGVASGHTGIQFKVVKINRETTTLSRFPDNDKKIIKRSKYGGIDATDATKNLNIWVVPDLYDPEDDSATFGYATFPENGGDKYDGVVMNAKAFGRSGTRLPGMDLGRTLTHEVGHYLDLLHIFGDDGCGDDLCADTPAGKKHFDNPSYPLYETCGGVKRSVMFMNYMDYCDDKSLYMFTKDQKARMQATVAADGGRSGLR
jgi:Pregnancy-associated plasma protein-A